MKVLAREFEGNKISARLFKNKEGNKLFKVRTVRNDKGEILEHELYFFSREVLPHWEFIKELKYFSEIDKYVNDNKLKEFYPGGK